MESNEVTTTSTALVSVGSRPTEDKKQKEPRGDWDDIR